MNVPPAIELVWERGQGASSCIDAGELAQKVEATLGRPVREAGRDARDYPRDAESGPRPSDRSQVSQVSQVLEGRVEPLATGGWIAVVEVLGGGATPLRREGRLVAPDCRQLDEALVLVVALMADATIPHAPPLVVPSRGPATSIAIGPDVSLAIGMLPGVATGFGFASDIAIPPYWHIAAWAYAWPISEALHDGSGARLAAWTFGTGPCVGTPSRERWSFFGCAGAGVGVVYANGVGLEVSRSRALPYVQTELRVGVRWRILAPLFLRLELGAALPVTRNAYQFTGADGAAHEVFRTAAVVPLGRLAVEFRSP